MKKERFWEIDFLRGLAIIKMIISNFIFDLTIFTTLGFSGFLTFFSRVPVAAVTFMFLVGLSLSLSYSRMKGKGRKEIYRKYLIRGARIFSLGLLITLTTWVFFNSGTIFFGVLHFVGLSIILAIPFMKFRKLNLVLGIVFIVIGMYLGTFSFDFPWLLWLGFVPKHFYTLDYFPIFPWFGLILIGLFAGNSLYPNGKRRFHIKNYSRMRPVKLFQFLGRNALLIYLIHQPIAIALIYLFII